MRASSVIVLVGMVGCGNTSPPGDAGRAISFRKDLLTAPSLPYFEGTCGLSPSCHLGQVKNPKTDRLFLGCSATNSSCTATGDVAEAVYTGLVGNPDAGMLVMSQELPSMPYVTPGNPDNSYSVRKLEGTLSGLNCVPVAMDPIVANAPGESPPLQPCGQQMPLNVPPDATFNAKVREWILQGALDN